MSELIPPVTSRDHVRGDPSGLVTLVEFGDYECPFCGKAYPVIQAVEEALGDRLSFAYRHFPIADAHPHALLAAESAEAADAQGMFWEMHDLLYEHQDALTWPDIMQYATTLGLDVEEFERDIRTHRFAAKVRADRHSGALSGVNGTPTLFINGFRHDGPVDFDSLWSAIVDGAGAGFYGGA
jgi:protein-disulfide isomerase